MKSFIAFSGGVESSAMCVLYGKNSTPIFTDTGFEHKPMYERIDMMESALGIIHGPDFKIIRLRQKNAESTGCRTLPEYIKLRKFYPNPMARFCTRLFKIEPMDDFLKDQGECEVFIGLNFDEADERVGNLGKCQNVKYRYPLIEDKKTRSDCEKILSNAGLLPQFPPYMSRGGCKGCFFKRKNEYRWMAHLAPGEALEVADLEESIQDQRGNYYHIHQDIPNMRRFIQNCRSEQFLFPEDAQSWVPSSGASCGILCHR